jgi:Ca-activated chloride channel family protein
MKFGAPAWLVAGLLAGILIAWMWRRHDARQQLALALFVSPHLRRQLTGSVSTVGRRLQRILFLAAVICLFTALAEPQLGYRWEQISRRGNEVVFAIDTSRSMETPDVKPNRLIRAKLAIDDMATQLDGDAIGIVAFAGSAFLVCPLTLDHGAFHESLDAIDVHTIPRGGTNISSAILEADSALRRRPGSDKTLILVTDGEDLEGSAVTAATAAARQHGLKIFTVGVGTAAGDLVPVPADQGGGFVKDESGALVKSHLDEGTLRAIASATGGLYVPLGAQGEGLEVISRIAFGAATKHDLAYRQQRIYIERYQWPLAASLLLLLASLIVGTRKWKLPRKAAVLQAAVMSGAWLILMLPIRSRSAGQTDAAGGQADVKAPLREYNAGTSAYRAGQFPQATQAFQQSIKVAPASDAKRLADQEDAYYNLGNALYRAGQQSEKAAPQDALQKWTAAVKAYETALQLRPDDADSKYNRDLVKRKIDALNQQQNQSQGQGNGQGKGGGGGQGNGKGNPPPQGQQGSPQNGKGEPQQNPPPPAQPRAGSTAPGQTAPSAPPASAAANAGQRPQDENDRAGDDQHLPGQMSREEARELLDSAKADEHHSLGVPINRRDPDETPDKPFKNW